MFGTSGCRGYARHGPKEGDALLPTTESQIIPSLPFLRQVLQCLPIVAHHHQFTVASDRTMLVADDDRHSGRIGKPWREHWQLFGRKFPRSEIADVLGLVRVGVEPCPVGGEHLLQLRSHRRSTLP